MLGARAAPLFDPSIRAWPREIFAESEGWKFLANSRSGEKEKEREKHLSMARSLVRKHLKARTPQQWMYLREPAIPFRGYCIALVFSVINCISGDDFRVDATAASLSWKLDVIVGRKKFMARWMAIGSQPFNEGRPTIKSKLLAAYRDVDIRGSLNGEWRTLG